jgi:hypothetical protein
MRGCEFWLAKFGEEASRGAARLFVGNMVKNMRVFKCL